MYVTIGVWPCMINHQIFGLKLFLIHICRYFTKCPYYIKNSLVRYYLDYYLILLAHLMR